MSERRGLSNAHASESGPTHLPKPTAVGARKLAGSSVGRRADWRYDWRNTTRSVEPITKSRLASELTSPMDNEAW